MDSLFQNLNDQIAALAGVLKNDTNLKDGFNLIGHSQGALVTRGYIERYNDPPVHNYISWVGPHAGVYGVPAFNTLCPDVTCPWIDDLVDDLLTSGASKATQKLISFAAYWKDPLNMTDYLADNILIADLNNEKATKNPTYKANIASLNHMALATASKDIVVVPHQSGHFEFFPSGSEAPKDILPLRQSPWYTEDWLGLRTLDEAGRLTTWEVPCAHSDVPRAVCKEYSYNQVARDLLNNTLP